MSAAEKITSVEDITDALQARSSKRVLYTFTVPPKLAAETGVKTLGLVELTAGEMELATARAGENKLAMGHELAKECLRAVDGKFVSTGDGSADAWWGSTESGYSKLRALVFTAYAKLHNPEATDAAAFLESQTARV